MTNRVNTYDLLFMDNLLWYSFLYIDTSLNYICYFCLQYLYTYAKSFCQIVCMHVSTSVKDILYINTILGYIYHIALYISTSG